MLEDHFQCEKGTVFKLDDSVRSRRSAQDCVSSTHGTLFTHKPYKSRKAPVPTIVRKDKILLADESYKLVKPDHKYHLDTGTTPNE